jgi:hypothetical protein
VTPFRKFVIGALIASGLAPVAAVYALYFHGLALAGGPPGPLTLEHFSQPLVAVAWADIERQRAQEIEPLGPLELTTRVLWEVNFGDHFPQWNSPGLRFAEHCARWVILVDRKRRMKAIDRHLALTALSLWLSSNWSARELMTCALEGFYFGHGFHGVSSAAAGYLGQSPSEIDHREAALLMFMGRRGARFDRQCKIGATVAELDDMLLRFEDSGLLDAAWHADKSVDPLLISSSWQCRKRNIEVHPNSYP